MGVAIESSDRWKDHGGQLRCLLVVGWVWAMGWLGALAQPADDWLREEGVTVPGSAPASAAALAEAFDASLTAAPVDGWLQVTWQPVEAPQGTAVVVASTGRVGPGVLRDWREYAMTRTGAVWVARLPLGSGREPVIYALREMGPDRTLLGGTPPRIFHPLRAGDLEPTFPFTGFLEGFEEGWEGWERADGRPSDSVLSRSEDAWSGRRALRVEVPRGRGSITVGTVRVQGWMLWENDLVSIRMMARTEGGEGRLRVALHSRARTPDLAVHPAPEVVVGPEWRRLEWALESFVGLRRREVDWMTLHFLAEEGVVLLLDDVELVPRSTVR